LSRAADHGLGAAVRQLLDSNYVALDSRDGMLVPPLTWSAAKGREGVVRLLLDRDAMFIYTTNLKSRTPLAHDASAENVSHGRHASFCYY
jgi:ankyrin repeat protein